MPASSVPDIVVGRLPLYLRALTQMAASGKEITSSQELGERLGISSAQIRKVDRIWEVALVGLGDLGRAIAHYAGFVDRGYRVVVVFESDPAKIGTQIGPLTIEDTSRIVEVVRARGITVAMLAVSRDAAQEVTDRLVEAGVHAIL